MNTSNDLLQTNTHGPTLDLVVVTEIVNAEAGMRLQAYFDHAVRHRAASVGRVRLDVSRLMAMSSAGFEALLRLHRACRDAKLPLEMSRPTGEFMELLTRMGFDRLFAVQHA